MTLFEAARQLPQVRLMCLLAEHETIIFKILHIDCDAFNLPVVVPALRPDYFSFDYEQLVHLFSPVTKSEVVNMSRNYKSSRASVRPPTLTYFKFRAWLLFCFSPETVKLMTWNLFIGLLFQIALSLNYFSLKQLTAQITGTVKLVAAFATAKMACQFCCVRVHLHC